ncbi:VTT domain-containing protein [Cohnella ginsengisoli]|uniref:TVP38/TMEM64 family membrane protein n=1 Tax=Cohnella ginsengisoli TaxID=425004 RepID=A0A9X4KK11_9BACL|nr:VTT domain-containing protein [Cohnella ginsengisoli]MDG0793679.1 VTT domain-containing protein [Cohnella ginsengisoli]
MSDLFNNAIDWLLETTNLQGFYVLLLTVPLAIVQGFFGIFPFSTLIFLQISALGLVNGLITSWLVGIIASLVVYYACKYLFADWFDRKMKAKAGRYEKWQGYFMKYGVWSIIFLRTLPIMPNNVISFMASLSKISHRSYMVSSFVGVMSHIWLFGIVSSSILFPETDIGLLIGSYLLFCAALTGIFAAQLLRERRRARGV